MHLAWSIVCFAVPFSIKFCREHQFCVNNGLCMMLQASAEREAWKIAKEHDLDLVTILPNFILGPALSRYDSKGLSVGFMKVSIIARQKDQSCQYTL